ncbi:hypothetical protein VTO42DRAFT_8154 [Malbranchea cinnamomea]
MFSSSKKPYTAVTVQIERLTSEVYEVDDSSGIVDLVEVIRLQESGPSEASRALRKKLKYGSVHRQLRALTILDYLIQNAGERFLRQFADEMLLERLRVAATDPVSDPEVKQKCKQLFGQWAATYSGTPGMERVAALYKQLPKRKKPVRRQQSKVLKETEQPAEVPMGHSVSVSAGNGPSTILTSPSTAKRSSVTLSSGLQSKKSGGRKRSKTFNLEKERSEILQTIASASIASTNLMNFLKLVNRENERVSDHPDVMSHFERCKNLRRQILRYIQHIENDELLGSLIHANEELVNALITFEVLDKSVDDDSDSESDMEVDHSRPQTLRSHTRGLSEDLSGLRLDGPATPPLPPRPTSISFSRPPLPTHAPRDDFESESEESDEGDDDDDDENNPFGDRNAIKTPSIEKPEPTWREV